MLWEYLSLSGRCKSQDLIATSGTLIINGMDAIKSGYNNCIQNDHLLSKCLVIPKISLSCILPPFYFVQNILMIYIIINASSFTYSIIKNNLNVTFTHPPGKQIILS